MVIVVLLYFIHLLFTRIGFNVWVNRGFATVFFIIPIFVLNIERKEFQRLPFIGKYLRQG